MIGKMGGSTDDIWQKYATLRLAYGYMFGHPGKKLLFMGGEFAQFHEWNYQVSFWIGTCCNMPTIKECSTLWRR